jgi:hypothetical protein
MQLTHDFNTNGEVQAFLQGIRVAADRLDERAAHRSTSPQDAQILHQAAAHLRTWVQRADVSLLPEQQHG